MKTKYCNDVFELKININLTRDKCLFCLYYKGNVWFDTEQLVSSPELVGVLQNV